MRDEVPAVELNEHLVHHVLSMDGCSPVENVASLVDGLLIQVVVSHRGLNLTVAHQVSKRC